MAERYGRSAPLVTLPAGLYVHRTLDFFHVANDYFLRQQRNFLHPTHSTHFLHSHNATTTLRHHMSSFNVVLPSNGFGNAPYVVGSSQSTALPIVEICNAGASKAVIWSTLQVKQMIFRLELQAGDFLTEPEFRLYTGTLAEFEADGFVLAAPVDGNSSIKHHASINKTVTYGFDIEERFTKFSQRVYATRQAQLDPTQFLIVGDLKHEDGRQGTKSSALTQAGAFSGVEIYACTDIPGSAVATTVVYVSPGTENSALRLHVGAEIPADAGDLGAFAGVVQQRLEAGKASLNVATVANETLAIESIAQQYPAGVVSIALEDQPYPLVAANKVTVTGVSIEGSTAATAGIDVADPPPSDATAATQKLTFSSHSADVTSASGTLTMNDGAYGSVAIRENQFVELSQAQLSADVSLVKTYDFPAASYPTTKVTLTVTVDGASDTIVINHTINEDFTSYTFSGTGNDTFEGITLSFNDNGANGARRMILTGSTVGTSYTIQASEELAFITGVGTTNNWVTSYNGPTDAIFKYNGTRVGFTRVEQEYSSSSINSYTSASLAVSLAVYNQVSEGDVLKRDGKTNRPIKKKWTDNSGYYLYVSYLDRSEFVQTHKDYTLLQGREGYSPNYYYPQTKFNATDFTQNLGTDTTGKWFNVDGIADEFFEDTNDANGENGELTHNIIYANEAVTFEKKNFSFFANAPTSLTDSAMGVETVFVKDTMQLQVGGYSSSSTTKDGAAVVGATEGPNIVNDLNTGYGTDANARKATFIPFLDGERKSTNGAYATVDGTDLNSAAGSKVVIVQDKRNLGVISDTDGAALWVEYSNTILRASGWAIVIEKSAVNVSSSGRNFRSDGVDYQQYEIVAVQQIRAGVLIEGYADGSAAINDSELAVMNAVLYNGQHVDYTVTGNPNGVVFDAATTLSTSEAGPTTTAGEIVQQLNARADLVCFQGTMTVNPNAARDFAVDTNGESIRVLKKSVNFTATPGEESGLSAKEGPALFETAGVVPLTVTVGDAVYTFNRGLTDTTASILAAMKAHFDANVVTAKIATVTINTTTRTITFETGLSNTTITVSAGSQMFEESDAILLEPTAGVPASVQLKIGNDMWGPKTYNEASLKDGTSVDFTTRQAMAVDFLTFAEGLSSIDAAASNHQSDGIVSLPLPSIVENYGFTAGATYDVNFTTADRVAEGQLLRVSLSGARAFTTNDVLTINAGHTVTIRSVEDAAGGEQYIVVNSTNITYGYIYIGDDHLGDVDSVQNVAAQPGGTGAQATMIVDENGIVTSIVVTDSGSGYAADDEVSATLGGKDVTITLAANDIADVVTLKGQSQFTGTADGKGFTVTEDADDKNVIALGAYTAPVAATTDETYTITVTDANDANGTSETVVYGHSGAASASTRQGLAVLLATKGFGAMVSSAAAGTNQVILTGRANGQQFTVTITGPASKVSINGDGSFTTTNGVYGHHLLTTDAEHSLFLNDTAVLSGSTNNNGNWTVTERVGTTQFKATNAGALTDETSDGSIYSGTAKSVVVRMDADENSSAAVTVSLDSSTTKAAVITALQQGLDSLKAGFAASITEENGTTITLTSLIPQLTLTVTTDPLNLFAATEYSTAGWSVDDKMTITSASHGLVVGDVVTIEGTVANNTANKVVLYKDANRFALEAGEAADSMAQAGAGGSIVILNKIKLTAVNNGTAIGAVGGGLTETAMPFSYQPAKLRNVVTERLQGGALTNGTLVRQLSADEPFQELARGAIATDQIGDIQGHFEIGADAAAYKLESSTDDGSTWTDLNQTGANLFLLSSEGINTPIDNATREMFRTLVDGVEMTESGTFEVGQYYVNNSGPQILKAVISGTDAAEFGFNDASKKYNLLFQGGGLSVNTGTATPSDALVATVTFSMDSNLMKDMALAEGVAQVVNHTITIADIVDRAADQVRWGYYSADTTTTKTLQGSVQRSGANFSNYTIQHQFGDKRNGLGTFTLSGTNDMDWGLYGSVAFAQNSVSQHQVDMTLTFTDPDGPMTVPSALDSTDMLEFTLKFTPTDDDGAELADTSLVEYVYYTFTDFEKPYSMDANDLNYATQDTWRVLHDAASGTVLSNPKFSGETYEDTNFYCTSRSNAQILDLPGLEWAYEDASDQYTATIDKAADSQSDQISDHGRKGDDILTALRALHNSQSDDFTVAVVVDFLAPAILGGYTRTDGTSQTFHNSDILFSAEDVNDSQKHKIHQLNVAVAGDAITLTIKADNASQTTLHQIDQANYPDNLGVNRKQPFGTVAITGKITQFVCVEDIKDPAGLEPADSVSHATFQPVTSGNFQAQRKAASDNDVEMKIVYQQPTSYTLAANNADGGAGNFLFYRKTLNGLGVNVLRMSSADMSGVCARAVSLYNPDPVDVIWSALALPKSDPLTNQVIGQLYLDSSDSDNLIPLENMKNIDNIPAGLYVYLDMDNVGSVRRDLGTGEITLTRSAEEMPTQITVKVSNSQRGNGFAVDSNDNLTELGLTYTEDPLQSLHVLKKTVNPFRVVIDGGDYGNGAGQLSLPSVAGMTQVVIDGSVVLHSGATLAFAANTDVVLIEKENRNITVGGIVRTSNELLGSIELLNSGFTAGTYYKSLTTDSGSGAGAKAKIVVSEGGAVTAIDVYDHGSAYAAGSKVSATLGAGETVTFALVADDIADIYPGDMSGIVENGGSVTFAGDAVVRTHKDYRLKREADAHVLGMVCGSTTSPTKRFYINREVVSLAVDTAGRQADAKIFVPCRMGSWTAQNAANLPIDRRLTDGIRLPATLSANLVVGDVVLVEGNCALNGKKLVVGPSARILAHRSLAETLAGTDPTSQLTASADSTLQVEGASETDAAEMDGIAVVAAGDPVLQFRHAKIGLQADQSVTFDTNNAQSYMDRCDFSGPVSGNVAKVQFGAQLDNRAARLEARKIRFLNKIHAEISASTLLLQDFDLIGADAKVDFQVYGATVRKMRMDASSDPFLNASSNPSIANGTFDQKIFQGVASPNVFENDIVLYKGGVNFNALARACAEKVATLALTASLSNLTEQQLTDARTAYDSVKVAMGAVDIAGNAAFAAAIALGADEYYLRCGQTYDKDVDQFVDSSGVEHFAGHMIFQDELLSNVRLTKDGNNNLVIITEKVRLTGTLDGTTATMAAPKILVSDVVLADGVSVTASTSTDHTENSNEAYAATAAQASNFLLHDSGLVGAALGTPNKKRVLISGASAQINAALTGTELAPYILQPALGQLDKGAYALTRSSGDLKYVGIFGSQGCPGLTASDEHVAILHTLGNGVASSTCKNVYIEDCTGHAMGAGSIVNTRVECVDYGERLCNGNLNQNSGAKVYAETTHRPRDGNNSASQFAGTDVTVQAPFQAKFDLPKESSFEAVVDDASRLRHWWNPMAPFESAAKLKDVSTNTSNTIVYGFLKSSVAPDDASSTVATTQIGSSDTYALKKASTASVTSKSIDFEDFNMGKISDSGTSTIQGGWTGGAETYFQNDNYERINNAAAQVGTKSWFQPGVVYNNPGTGSPHTPSLGFTSAADLQGKVFEVEFYFKADDGLVEPARLGGMPSTMDAEHRIYCGTFAGDNRGVFNIQIKDSPSGVRVYTNKHIGSTDGMAAWNANPPGYAEHDLHVDLLPRDAWHKVNVKVTFSANGMLAPHYKEHVHQYSVTSAAQMANGETVALSEDIPFWGDYAQEYWYSDDQQQYGDRIAWGSNGGNNTSGFYYDNITYSLTGAGAPSIDLPQAVYGPAMNEVLVADEVAAVAPGTNKAMTSAQEYRTARTASGDTISLSTLEALNLGGGWDASRYNIDCTSHASYDVLLLPPHDDEVLLPPHDDEVSASVAFSKAKEIPIGTYIFQRAQHAFSSAATNQNNQGVFSAPPRREQAFVSDTLSVIVDPQPYLELSVDGNALTGATRTRILSASQLDGGASGPIKAIAKCTVKDETPWGRPFHPPTVAFTAATAKFTFTYLASNPKIVSVAGEHETASSAGDTLVLRLEDSNYSGNTNGLTVQNVMESEVPDSQYGTQSLVVKSVTDLSDVVIASTVLENGIHTVCRDRWYALPTALQTLNNVVLDPGVRPLAGDARCTITSSMSMTEDSAQLASFIGNFTWTQDSSATDQYAGTLSLPAKSQTLSAGTIESDETFDKTTIIQGRVVITGNVTVDAGTQILFKDGAELIISGTFTVNATSDADRLKYPVLVRHEDDHTLQFCGGEYKGITCGTAAIKNLMIVGGTNQLTVNTAGSLGGTDANDGIRLFNASGTALTVGGTASAENVYVRDAVEAVQVSAGAGASLKKCRIDDCLNTALHMSGNCTIENLFVNAAAEPRDSEKSTLMGSGTASASGTSLHVKTGARKLGSITGLTLVENDASTVASALVAANINNPPRDQNAVGDRMATLSAMGYVPGAGLNSKATVQYTETYDAFYDNADLSSLSDTVVTQSADCTVETVDYMTALKFSADKIGAKRNGTGKVETAATVNKDATLNWDGVDGLAARSIFSGKKSTAAASAPTSIVRAAVGLTTLTPAGNAFDLNTITATTGQTDLVRLQAKAVNNAAASDAITKSGSYSTFCTLGVYDTMPDFRVLTAGAGSETAVNNRHTWLLGGVDVTGTGTCAKKSWLTLNNVDDIEYDMEVKQGTAAAQAATVTFTFKDPNYAAEDKILTINGASRTRSDVNGYLPNNLAAITADLSDFTASYSDNTSPYFLTITGPADGSAFTFQLNPALVACIDSVQVGGQTISPTTNLTTATGTQGAPTGRVYGIDGLKILVGESTGAFAASAVAVTVGGTYSKTCSLVEADNRLATSASPSMNLSKAGVLGSTDLSDPKTLAYQMQNEAFFSIYDAHAYGIADVRHARHGFGAVATDITSATSYLDVTPASQANNGVIDIALKSSVTIPSDSTSVFLDIDGYIMPDALTINGAHTLLSKANGIAGLDKVQGAIRPSIHPRLSNVQTGESITRDYSYLPGKTSLEAPENTAVATVLLSPSLGTQVLLQQANEKQQYIDHYQVFGTANTATYKGDAPNDGHILEFLRGPISTTPTATNLTLTKNGDVMTLTGSVESLESLESFAVNDYVEFAGFTAGNNGRFQLTSVTPDIKFTNANGVAETQSATAVVMRDTPTATNLTLAKSGDDVMTLTGSAESFAVNDYVEFAGFTAGNNGRFQLTSVTPDIEFTNANGVTETQSATAVVVRDIGLKIVDGVLQTTDTFETTTDVQPSLRYKCAFGDNNANGGFTFTADVFPKVFMDANRGKPPGTIAMLDGVGSAPTNWGANYAPLTHVLDQHASYVGPFGGAAAVSLNAVTSWSETMAEPPRLFKIPAGHASSSSSVGKTGTMKVTSADASGFQAQIISSCCIYVTDAGTSDYTMETATAADGTAPVGVLKDSNGKEVLRVGDTITQGSGASATVSKIVVTAITAGGTYIQIDVGATTGFATGNTASGDQLQKGGAAIFAAEKAISWEVHTSIYTGNNPFATNTDYVLFVSRTDNSKYGLLKMTAWVNNTMTLASADVNETVPHMGVNDDLLFLNIGSSVTVADAPGDATFKSGHTQGSPSITNAFKIQQNGTLKPDKMVILGLATHGMKTNGNGVYLDEGNEYMLLMRVDNAEITMRVDNADCPGLKFQYRVLYLNTALTNPYTLMRSTVVGGASNNHLSNVIRGTQSSVVAGVTTRPYEAVERNVGNIDLDGATGNNPSHWASITRAEDLSGILIVNHEETTEHGTPYLQSQDAVFGMLAQLKRPSMATASVAGSGTTVTFTFTTRVAVAADGKVVVSLPSSFGGQVVEQTGVTRAAGVEQTISVTNVALGATGTGGFEIYTTDAAGTILEAYHKDLTITIT